MVDWCGGGGWKAGGNSRTPLAPSQLVFPGRTALYRAILAALGGELIDRWRVSGAMPLRAGQRGF